MGRRDVLKECGMDVDALTLGEKMPEGGVKHVQAEGYDIDEKDYSYGGSFPIEKAFDGLGEVILAYEMNGEELPRDHGYPVRLIIPGHVGARQVKWLHRLHLSDQVGGSPIFYNGPARFISLMQFQYNFPICTLPRRAINANRIYIPKGKYCPVKVPLRLLCEHPRSFSLPILVCIS
jgi:hypothetical protein